MTLSSVAIWAGLAAVLALGLAAIIAAKPAETTGERTDFDTAMGGLWSRLGDRHDL